MKRFSVGVDRLILAPVSIITAISYKISAVLKPVKFIMVQEKRRK